MLVYANLVLDHSATVGAEKLTALRAHSCMVMDGQFIGNKRKGIAQGGRPRKGVGLGRHR